MTENFDRLDKTFNVTSDAEVVEEKTNKTLLTHIHIRGQTNDK